MTTEEKEILAAKLEEQKIDVTDYLLLFFTFLSIIPVYLFLFVSSL